MSDESSAPGASDSSDTSTRATQIRFLAAIAKCGVVTEAAEAVPMHRDTHYGWLERDKDGSYAKEFSTAMDQYRDRVRTTLSNRALDGWQEPIVYQGVIVKDDDGKVATVTKIDNRLLQTLAEAHLPEFRPKHEIATTHTHTVYDLEKLSKLTDDELRNLDALTRKFAAPRRDRSGDPST